MKANLTLDSVFQKAGVILAFLPLTLMVYPEVTVAAHPAQNLEEKALVFDISSKSNTETQENQKSPNQNLLSYADLARHQAVKDAENTDTLAPKVQKYLESKGSPLAGYAEQIVQQPQWQRALAISFVESNFGKRCADNNCSGIGIKPGHKLWRKYPTKLHWFKDMSALLEKPIYKQKYTTCSTMKGVYVVPGSAKWVNGCNKVSNELLAITKQAEQEKLALIESARNSTVSIASADVEIK